MTISYLRMRRQKSGKVYYYLELPSTTGRREIALGPNKELALEERQSMLIEHFSKKRTEPNDAQFAVKVFKEIVVPMLNERAKKENTRSIAKLTEFFKAHPEMTLVDVPSPFFEEVYYFWRGESFSLVTQNEISLARRICATFMNWQSSPRQDCTPLSRTS